MLKISILMVYLLSQDKGISGVSKFSLYKQKTELKRNPTTKAPPDYTGPPILNVNWEGHPNLPEEVNNAEILKEIMQKVAEYKRYEYCPFSKKIDDCESKSVNEIVDKIIDVVLHPTEPPTEPPAPTPVNTEQPIGESNEGNNEEENDNDKTEGTIETEGNEGTDGGVDTADTTEEGQESSTVEAASENSGEEPTDAPAA